MFGQWFGITVFGIDILHCALVAELRLDSPLWCLLTANQVDANSAERMGGVSTFGEWIDRLPLGAHKGESACSGNVLVFPFWYWVL